MAAEEQAKTEAAAKPAAAPEVKPAVAAPPAPQAAKPKAAAAKPVVEKQTNCLACNKQLKKLRRYYRDGKYYCTKRCWINFKNKDKEENKE